MNFALLQAAQATTDAKLKEEGEAESKQEPHLMLLSSLGASSLPQKQR